MLNLTMLNVLWKYKGQIAVGVAVLAACLYIMSLKGQIQEYQVKASKLEGTVAELNVKLDAVTAECNNNLATQQGSITALKTSITRQNNTIKTLSDQLKMKDAELIALKKSNEEEKKKHQEELTAILLEPKPVDCSSSIEYLINGKGDLTWKRK